jgi:hypothetical protein
MKDSLRVVLCVCVVGGAAVTCPIGEKRFAAAA